MALVISVMPAGNHCDCKLLSIESFVQTSIPNAGRKNRLDLTRSGLCQTNLQEKSRLSREDRQAWAWLPRSGSFKRGWTTFSLPDVVKTHWMLPSLKLERT